MVAAQGLGPGLLGVHSASQVPREKGTPCAPHRSNPSPENPGPMAFAVGKVRPELRSPALAALGLPGSESLCAGHLAPGPLRLDCHHLEHNTGSPTESCRPQQHMGEAGRNRLLSGMHPRQKAR